MTQAIERRFMWISLGIVLLGAVTLRTQEARGPGSATPAPEIPALVRIGPGDLLELTVFDVPELAQTLRVSDRGDTVLTLLGSVHIAGMTTQEAQVLIEVGLRKGNYLVDPHVALIIREYGTQGVSVLGEVRKPGVYQVLGKRTLLDVISEAGGTTPLAAHEATIKRRSRQETLTASLANNPAELLAAETELQPGDTVIVPKAGIVYVIGDVGRPGGYLMQNSGKMSLLEAIALAQGVNRTAAVKNTQILHKNGPGYGDTTINLKQVLAGKHPDLQLEPEDIVYIPPSTPKMLLWRGPSVMQSAASAAVYQAVP